MVDWQIVYTRQAQKDAKKLSASGLRPKAEVLLEILKINPFQSPPHFEKLVGDLDGAYSRRINIQHRLVYQIFRFGLSEAQPLPSGLKESRTVKVIRMWTHYE